MGDGSYRVPDVQQDNKGGNGWRKRQTVGWSAVRRENRAIKPGMWTTRDALAVALMQKFSC